MRSRLPLKFILLILAAATLAGCGRSDIDRAVKLRPDQVYHAFSKTMPASGTDLVPDMGGPDGEHGPFTAKVEKDPDKSIEISGKLAGLELLDINLRFDPLADGAQTRVRADIRVNPIIFAASRNISSKDARELIREALDHAIDEVAAGHSLKPMNIPKMAEGRPYRSYRDDEPQPAESIVARERWDGGQSSIPMSGGRVVPMQSGKPMLDPNAVARKHSFHGSDW